MLTIDAVDDPAPGTSDRSRNDKRNCTALVAAERGRDRRRGAQRMPVVDVR
jgi:hypothetical protein